MIDKFLKFYGGFSLDNFEIFFSTEVLAVANS